MEKQINDISELFVSFEERERLLRLCTSIVGSRDIAEDLVQETLLEAWRHLENLRDPSRRASWLSGIARNVYLRWLRKTGRDNSRLLLPTEQDTSLPALEEIAADDFDIEVELERKELIELLDRALAQLPEETRLVLIKRYVEESPLSELAEQLGANISTVAMRLQRGKLALRQILTSDMQSEIAPYRILPPETDEWEETPLWCHYCGMHRLLGKRKPEEGRLLLKCPACSPGENEVLSWNHIDILIGVKGYKPLTTRLMTWCNGYYYSGLQKGHALCKGCGRTTPVKLLLPQELPDWASEKSNPLWWHAESKEPLITIACDSCKSNCNTSLEGLTLCLPEGRQFLQAHPRVLLLPRQEVEAEGRPAILTRYESVTDSATLTIVSDKATYQVLRIYGGER
jgi:RNA polymerase sigma-70 factor (ECF subfamily)